MNPVTTFSRVLRLSCLALGLLATTTLPLSAQRLAQQLQAQQAQNAQQQPPADDVELSADEIIQVLRENPDVLADAKVCPRTSSITCTYMCLWLRNTLSRGRVESRLMRLRTRNPRRRR